jgi:hypothetical protein|tara:strand:+ start:3073 stop:3354 length:282 start_codon:yes stop_codon:yes gene_type:complete
MSLVLRIDRELGYSYSLFKDEDELKECLQDTACDNSGYSDEEYNKENGHVSLDEYCEMYNYSYIKFTHEQIKEALREYAEKNNLKDNWNEEII